MDMLMGRDKKLNRTKETLDMMMVRVGLSVGQNRTKK